MCILTAITQKHLEYADDDYGTLDVSDAILPFHGPGFGTHSEQVHVGRTFPFLQTHYGQRACHVHETDVLYDRKPIYMYIKII